ncbi:hypothetical protein [Vulgatibacter incomptus]|uniref:Lipoprotein n=1 Tax=Vulgatibacter incomptus TaxID=1391653 RepID=A0A0K1PC14_9BACT|nr:hypothetical protein [Vulgatibacter incomptus]AKU91042.1 hypothetical protein AKJ08_1429 [Vulgatibacter incomptus]
MGAGRVVAVARLCISLLLCVLVSGACGEVLLEGGERRKPKPPCDEGFELDPDNGECVPKVCRSDDDCKKDLRCDPIEGKCVLARCLLAPTACDEK